MEQLREQLREARDRIEGLKQEIANVSRMKTDGSLSDANVEMPAVSTSFAARRTLRGHFGKVYALHWAGDATHLVSASQDGKLLVWNAYTMNKAHVVPLRSSWVMTCAFEPSNMRLVASGGLDNTCSIYHIDQPQVARATKELNGHEGYLSCCRFLDEQSIITSSGDCLCILWDAERGSARQEFADHVGDVMSVALCPQNDNMFVSGSCDSTVKNWDTRQGTCTHTFRGHETDVNTVDFLGNGSTIASGSDDGTCRLFDIRCYGQVACLGNTKQQSRSVTSLAFSKSGRLLFAGYDTADCLVWDTCSGSDEPVQVFRDRGNAAHESRISTVGVNNTGQAVATGSWSSLIKIWA